MPYEFEGSVIASLYDGDYDSLRTPCGDVDFYVEEARRSGGPVAEFGCGTGRILVPTAEAGVAIAGVDSSEPMLAQARAKLEGRDLPATLHRGDMRDYDLGREFALVTIPFRAIAHVEEADDHVRVFRNMRRHVAPGGRFVFDFYLPHPLKQATIAAGERLDFEREESGRRIRRYSSTVFHVSRQVSDVRFRWEIEDADGSIEERETSFGMRWFYRFELEHLLARTGFEIESIHGDFDRSPIGDDSPEMIFVATPRSPR